MEQISTRPISTTAVATAALVPLFAPYCQEPDLARLEQGLAALQAGQVSGSRLLQGGAARPYVLAWSGSLAPLEPLNCQLHFVQLPGVQYSFVVPAHRLLAWLQQASAGAGELDLPDAFWRWLILGVDPGSAA